MMIFPIDELLDEQRCYDSFRLTARRQGSVPFRRVPPAADTRSPAQDQSPEANSRPPGESLPG